MQRVAVEIQKPMLYMYFFTPDCREIFSHPTPVLNISKILSTGREPPTVSVECHYATFNLSLSVQGVTHIPASRHSPASCVQTLVADQQRPPSAD